MHRRRLFSLVSIGAVAGLASASNAATLTFQQGLTMSNGLLYWGAQDTEIRQASNSLSFGNNTTVNADLEGTDGNAATQVQAMLKFNSIFGSLGYQIPFGSTINSVSLTFRTVNTSPAVSLHRMLSPWHEQTTWNSVRTGGGIAANNVSASTSADVSFTPTTNNVDVVLSNTALKNTVQAWSSKTTTNEGWAILPNSTNGWDFDSSEFATQSLRPKLTVDYTPAAATNPTPKNVILMVGDGMGLEAIKAARMKINGDTAPLNFETFANKALMTHNNNTDALTDSAASATAMATGVKVVNGAISHNGADLTTVLDILKARGKSTGLVTTGTAITDATPAAFAAHDPSRNNAGPIAAGMLATKPNVLMGQPGGMTTSAAETAGYTVVTDEAGLNAVNANTETHVAGLFSGVSSTSGLTLGEMTTKALDVLDNDNEGFFLLVENEDVDSGAHARNITQTIQGVESLTGGVKSVLDWLDARNLNDTLVIVLADHETGNLTVTANNGKDNNPTVTWNTNGAHTQTPIGVFAFGPGSDLVNGTLDNTDIFSILTVPEPSSAMLVGVGLVGLMSARRRRN